MRTKFYSRDYSVLEIILSVAILAAFSVFVLRLFVAAAQEKQRMLDLDAADYGAVSYIEQFRAGSAPFALSTALGGAPINGRYSRTVAISSGLTARIRIMPGEKNAGGQLYTIEVFIYRNQDGKQIFDLSDAGYFPAGSGNFPS